jgi:hypothetical protein
MIDAKPYSLIGGLSPQMRPSGIRPDSSIQLFEEKQTPACWQNGMVYR